MSITRTSLATVLYSMLSILHLSTLAAAYAVPPSKAPSQSPFSTNNMCTFTLFHKQLCSSFTQTQKNYIQINTIYDHTNDITVDVALHRPKEAFNSYTEVSPKSVFAIEGLLDNTSLIVKGEDGKDEVTFEYAAWKWSSEDRNGDAWCDVSVWDARWETCGDEGSVNPRQRMMQCAFPCDVVAEEDETRIELV
ncbi:hypothetical protein P153DRAFT_388620 [Dothidotthia symphoricarpi CBS 119687]|uniref:Uncharacterized protein n=1 Tax=Dothidotthia symphoricarpi CBS 119687 TaxID=1392245 RepID=A0A6A6A4X0_9PLEO|nr:uncharacterized protein P153DRAFT_388620 [Dothidotthia symphoricarpi CBS 119687]KAF2126586.1 hypothetical protein P153DRAFT_388620 [Dothidotthia symphoricarpi CBS 119687]